MILLKLPTRSQAQNVRKRLVLYCDSSSLTVETAFMQVCVGVQKAFPERTYPLGPKSASYVQ